MIAIYDHDSDIIKYTPSSAVAAGEVVVIGSTVGIATSAIAAEELGSLVTRGQFTVAMAAVNITAGQKLYFDTANDVVTNLQSGNTFFGVAVTAATSGTATVKALLMQDAGAVVVDLVDDSGGTAAATIAVIGATYDQAEVANAIASLAAQIAAINA